MNPIKEIPLIINRDNVFIYGILRTSELCKEIVIMVPALTGDRLGPQNIFVEIGRKLVEHNIACLCVEFPPSGDSYDLEQRNFWGQKQRPIFNMYAFYLDKVLAFLVEQYTYSKVFIGSISVGCLPVLDYCRKKGLAGVVLLSPNHFDSTPALLNKRNLRSYFYKAFQVSTWKKLLSLQINYAKIFNNIVKMPKPSPSGIPPNNRPPADGSKVYVLCIFGERDPALLESQKYWASFVMRQSTDNYKEVIIAGSDHSFFGWLFKVEVCNTIVNWINLNDE
jgi:hypothetical protein